MVSSPTSLSRNLFRIISFGTFARIFLLTLSALLCSFYEPYDSAASLPPFDRVPRALRGLLSWDAQNFLRIARTSISSRGVDVKGVEGIQNIFSFDSGNGGYADFEQLHAFFPLYPVFIAIVTNGLAFSLQSIFLDKEGMLAFSAVLINNISTIISACLLYLLGRRVLLKDGKLDDFKERIAYTSALLFCISPGGIFFSAAYSEGLFAALSFAGMLTAEYASDDPRFFISLFYLSLASCLFMIASAVRSNGILLIGYVIYSSFRRISSSRNTFNIYALTLACFTILLCIGISFPYTAFQFFGYSLFCTSSQFHNNIGPELSNLKSSTFVTPHWCSNQSPFFLHQIPSVYAHVQSKYWNIGFMNYWQIKHLGMFILALPILSLAFGAVSSHSFNMFQLIAFIRSSMFLKPVNKVIIDKELPYVLHMLFLSVFAIFFTHVQVATRLLSSSCPHLYWHAAYIFLTAPRSSWKRITLLAYFCGYSIIGTALFSLHYNWT